MTASLTKGAHSEGNNTLAISGHAEGVHTIAKAAAAHAEGEYTIADGAYSHTEGYGTIATNNGSHSEGFGRRIESGFTITGEGNSTTYTVTPWTDDIIVGRIIEYEHHLPVRIVSVDKDTSSITLYNTLSSTNLNNAVVYFRTGIASGAYSHAEGSNTEAIGNSSHAEGVLSMASGAYSHAEGLKTQALSVGQHVQGKSNIIDTENKYAHIVGNGKSEDTRSNAHTLDWKGNAWFQGDVYISSTSGTNKDEGSKKLATEEFVTQKVAEINIETPTEYESIILKSSASGSTKKFRLTINDDGVLSAEEVIE